MPIYIMSDAAIQSDELAGLYDELNTILAEDYFIIGRTNKGARFTSPEYHDVKDALNDYDDYKTMVSYFGGGEITLYAVYYEDIDIIKYEKVG